MMGNEDYNKCRFRTGKWYDNFVEQRVLAFSKNCFVKSNAEILKQHSVEGYEAVLASNSVHEMYHRSMLHFSGFTDPHEAEQQINGFYGGNGWLVENTVPILGVYTD